MGQELAERFEMIARAKLAAVMDVYRRLQMEPPEPGDKALHQRQATAKIVLSHIALLRKLLGEDAKTAAVLPVELDMEGYRAMIDALDEAEHG